MNNISTTDSRGFPGTISPELQEQCERMKQHFLEQHPDVTDADLNTAILDHQREKSGVESDEVLVADLEKRLGLR